jgi:hypothetical protein
VASRTASRVARIALIPTAIVLGACSDLTAPLLPVDARENTAQGVGDVFVMQQTDPHGATVVFSFTHDFAASGVPSPFVLADGQLEIFNSVPAGTYTLTQTSPAGWVLTESGDGYVTECTDMEGASAIDVASGVATIVVAPGGFVVCTFVNREGGDPEPEPPVEEPPAEESPVEPPPPVPPLGSGAWKKEFSCGNDRPGKPGSTVASTSAWLDAVVPFGTLTSLTCAEAAHLLAKQDFDGTGRASDGAYNLASQLLTARFNAAAGTEVPECVAEIMDAAQDLLVDVGFNGRGESLGPRTVNKQLRSSALSLAETLGLFNDGAADGGC